METKTCNRCGEAKPETEWYASQWSRSGAWCRTCYKEWHRARYVPKEHADATPRECAHCGVVFTPKIRNATQRFCSSNCKMNARYWRLNPRETRACEQCGIDISHMNRKARFCSNPCMQKHNNDKKTPAQRRAAHLKSNYGISPDDYERMLAAQGGACAICGNAGEQSRFGLLHVDHGHKSGQVRGLLCDSCNLSIGKFRDDPAMLRRAAAYIERGGFVAAH